MTTRIIKGGALESLRTLPDRSVQMCVTSPPYYGLRDYKHPDQVGLEKTPEEYECPENPSVPSVVLDPFAGSGTTGMVAERLYRNAILIDLNPDYAEMSDRRVTNDQPLFNQTTTE